MKKIGDKTRAAAWGEYEKIRNAALAEFDKTCRKETGGN